MQNQNDKVLTSFSFRGILGALSSLNAFDLFNFPFTRLSSELGGLIEAAVEVLFICFKNCSSLLIVQVLQL
jgi:hypothetical protein